MYVYNGKPINECEYTRIGSSWVIMEDYSHQVFWREFAEENNLRYALLHQNSISDVAIFTNNIKLQRKLTNLGVFTLWRN
jgi:hypothetical protein